VEGRGAASPLGPERCWIILLGGIVRVVFGIEQRWTPNVGIQVLRLEPPKHERNKREGDKCGGLENTVSKFCKKCFHRVRWGIPRDLFIGS
jgi:hypothetical protein